ncbi:MAG TPA: peptidyl-prolyl cis-trans isomerase [Candidatus Eubacterium faecavium]|nr:peptidyl-prolyl cis-trans isomerase [Candidatus Eubacterium faecavium]
MSKKDFDELNLNNQSEADSEGADKKTQAADTDAQISEKANSEADALNAADEETVRLEDNDNWQFEASAPAAENDVFSGVGGVEFELPKEQRAAENQDVMTQVKSQDIVIKKGRISIVLSSLIAVVIVAALVVLGIRYYTQPNSNEKMNPGNIALTVGDTDVSVGMYNYYYESIVYEYTYYANYGYYDLDTSADFSTQYTTDSDGNEISWLDLFKKITVERIKTNVVYYEKGLEAGITLTDEQKEEIESQLDSVRENASASEQSVNEYIEDTFGAHCGIETLRKYMEQYYIAGTYYNQYHITGRPDEEETQTYFDEHQDEYKSCSYALLEMAYDTTDDSTRQDSIEKAQSYMARITDVDSMRALVPEACADLIDQFISAGYFETEDEAVTALSESIEATQTRTDIESSFGEEIANWMFDESNETGSTNCYANEDVGIVYVLLKTSQPFLEDTQVYSVRHILVIPGSDDEESADNASSESQEYTEEQWNAALEKAESIVDEYNATDKSELSFAKLAEKYSDDTESTASGTSGLYGGGYEGVALGQMVSEFENWAMDDSRKYGDVEIVKTVHGYHIMYFIFRGPEYMYDSQVACFNAAALAEIENTQSENGLGMRNADSATPSSSYIAPANTQY